jgi:5-amino-6-(5-phospho-D-ribitylamino)uracil phosphatase
VIRLLAIDIDGTLLDGRGRLPDAHRDALLAASERGVEVALVTGRAFHFAKPVADLLPIPLTLIVNNGAVVKRKTGETERRHVLARAAARRILAETLAYEDSVALVFDRSDERQILFDRMDWSHTNRRGYYEKNKAFIARAAPLTDVLSDDPIQVMFNGGVETMRTLAASLRALPIAAEYTVAVTEYPARDFSLVDVNGAGCSKGSTLAGWAATRGLTAADVMAVGDNLNDVEMLDFAGTAVVMGNASDAAIT